MGFHSHKLRQFIIDPFEGVDYITPKGKKLDFKESTKQFAMFTIVEKDLLFDYLCFCDWYNHSFSVVKIRKIPHFTTKRAIRITQAIQLSEHHSDNITVTLKWIDTYL